MRRLSAVGLPVLAIFGLISITGGCPGADQSSSRNTPPTLTNPVVEGTLVANSPASVTVSCDVTDPDGTVESVTADLSAIGGITAQALSAGTGNSWSWTGTITPTTPGTQAVVLRAVDDGADAATVTVNVQVAPAVTDNVPPVVTIDQATGSLTQWQAGALTIVATCTDSDGTVVSALADLSAVGGPASQAATARTGDTWTWLVNVTPTVAGNRTVSVTVTDDDGATAVDSAQVLVAAGVRRAVQVSGGTAHSAALMSDGTIEAWGENSHGETTVPPGHDYAAVAAGDEFTLALKTDGSLVGWGKNDEGQTDVPAGTDYTAVAAGESHGLALKKDGSVVAWGRNHKGQTDVPAGLKAVAIAAGDEYSLAVKEDGTLVSWGDGVQGGVAAGSDFVAVAAGGAQAVALRTDATVAAWPEKLAGDDLWAVFQTGTYTQVDSGAHFIVALRSDGKVVVETWPTHLPVPVPLVTAVKDDAPTAADFVAVAAGEYHCVAIRDTGQVVAWGMNDSGQCDVPAGLR